MKSIARENGVWGGAGVAIVSVIFEVIHTGSVTPRGTPAHGWNGHNLMASWEACKSR